MTLKQWQQKNKYTDQQAAHNCNMKLTTYLYIRKHKSPKTSVLNVMRIMGATGLELDDLVKGNTEVKKLIKKIKKYATTKNN